MLFPKPSSWKLCSQNKRVGWLGFGRLCPESKIVDKLRVPVWVGLLRQNSIGLQERFGKQAIDETLILV